MVTPLVTTEEEVMENVPMVVDDEAAAARAAVAAVAEAEVPATVLPVPAATTDPKAIEVKVIEST